MFTEGIVLAVELGNEVKKAGQYESRTRDLGVTELPGSASRISTTL